jgi:hypothetical protein
MRKPVRLLMVLAALVSLIATGNAAASPDNARAEHQRIVDFWTHARVAQAQPRHFVVVPGRGFALAKPENPGKPGGGGGGGDSSVVTGASWTTGGDVLETTGKVLFAMGDSYFVCSASVVTDGSTTDGDALILTAGHCAYDETNGEFATNWMFIPEYDSAPAPLDTQGNFCADTQWGCWTARALTVHSGYATAGGFNDQAVVHDYAFATVALGGHGGDDRLDATVGVQGIRFDALDVSTAAAYAFGYPAAQKYKGNDLTYCAGAIGTDPNVNDQTYRLACDMTGGSSGGPWLAPFVDDPNGPASHGTGTLSSVNSYGYRGDSHMYGPMFSSKTEVVYNAANGSTANRVAGGS